MILPIFLREGKNKVEKIYCFPGNAGTKQIAENIEIDLSRFIIIKDNFYYNYKVMEKETPVIENENKKSGSLPL